MPRHHRNRLLSRLCLRAAAATAAFGLVLAAGPVPRAGAQDKPAPIQEKVTVALKLVQAYVTAKNGRPVTDLAAADFEVTDNGKPVTVTHFENHVLGGDELAPAGPFEASRLGRKFLFLFDFAFTDPRSARKAREAALEFIDTAVRPGDEVGVLSYSPSRGLTIHEYLTTDHAKVRTIVDAFGLRSVVGRAESLTNFLYADELRLMDAGDLTQKPGVEEFYENLAKAQTGGVVDEGRRQGYVDQARQFAQTFANLARALRYVPGWKNMILFSSGISRSLITGQRKGLDVPNMDAGNPDQMMAELNAYDNAQSNTGVRTEFSEALKELKTSNTPIYAIDCAPPLGESDINNPYGTSVGAREVSGKDSLIQLAGETGGRYFSNTTDYKNALAEVENVTSAFYVLGYTVPAAWDGAFHKIKVKVARPGCKVFSQNGYYNPKPFSQYGRFERLLQMTDLALSDNPLAELPAEAPMAALPVLVGGWPHVVAYAGLDAATARSVVGARAEAYLLIYDEGQGRSAIKSFRIKPPQEGYADLYPVFAVPLNPGRYTCRLIVQNTETGRGARGQAAFVVPKPGAAPLALDPPLLLDERAGATESGADANSTLSALFGHDPAKYAPWTGPLPAGPRRVYAAVRCALTAPETELAFTAADTVDGIRTEVPATVVSARTARNLRQCVVELAFGALAPGTHTLTVEARDPSGTMRGEATASFAVR
jgi:VWFA-related protein